MHARWAMLGVVALLAIDAAGAWHVPSALEPAPPGGGAASAGGAAAAWAPAAIAAAVAATAEVARMARLWGVEGLERRAYPGGPLDPLAWAGGRGRKSSGSGDAAGAPPSPPPPGAGVFAPWLGGAAGWLAGGWWWQQRRRRDGAAVTARELREMRWRELRNGRLAMVSFAGVAAAALLTGEGPLTLLARHLDDPLHNTVLSVLSSSSASAS